MSDSSDEQDKRNSLQSRETTKPAEKPAKQEKKLKVEQTDDLNELGGENYHTRSVWNRNPITKLNQSTNVYFRVHPDKRRDLMLAAVAHQALFVILLTGIFGYIAASQVFALIIFDNGFLPKLIIGYLLFLLFFFYMAKGIRRTRPMNYFALLCFSSLLAASAIILATQFDYKEIAMLLLNLTCLFVCMVIFLIVTKVNLQMSTFLFAVLALGSSNIAILVYFSGKKLNTVVIEAGLAVLYALHYGQRLCKAIDGNRGDITEYDYLYLGLINFMDLPHYLTAIVSTCVPLHKWCELNEEYLPQQQINTLAKQVREADEREEKDYYEKRAKMQSDLYSIFQAKGQPVPKKSSKRDKKNK